jgi:hypothetical protein
MLQGHEVAKMMICDILTSNESSFMLLSIGSGPSVLCIFLYLAVCLYLAQLFMEQLQESI